MTGALAGAGFDEGCVDLGGGRRIRYLAAGAGPAILLVHGLGGAASNWVSVAPALAATHRVLVPDLPGHGGSSPATGARDLTPFADALAALLDCEGALPACVVGHSLGGLVGIRLAVRHPGTAAGLLLAATAGISSTRAYAKVATRVLGVLRPGTRLAPHRERIGASPALRRAVFGWWGAADTTALSPTAVDGFLAGWESHTDTLRAARAMVGDDVRVDLGHVRCPCLVLWGARDNQVGIGDGFDFARRLRAPIRVIPDCGHLLIGERPDAVVDAVEALLDALHRIRELDELPLDPEVLRET